MFGIHYIKAAPTQYIIHYARGRKKRAGTGLAFFYYKPTAAIVVVPVGSADVPFIFNEISQDFQSVTVQGELTYRVHDPELVASFLNYAVDVSPAHYSSEDPLKLPQRLINLLQVLVRAEVQRLPLKNVIHASELVASAVFARLVNHEALKSLGVEVMAVSIQGIKAVPEIARALEAEAREDLLRRSDQAIYDRRNASVEQERRIKENEMNTEIVVEEKKRLIREARVDADLAVETKEQEVCLLALDGQIKLEEERRHLVATRSDNARLEADVQAYAMEASIKPFKDLEPAVLQMLSVQSADPRQVMSMAFKEIAQNAGKIGNLFISPELLEMLMRSPGPGRSDEGASGKV